MAYHPFSEPLYRAFRNFSKNSYAASNLRYLEADLLDAKRDVGICREAMGVLAVALRIESGIGANLRSVIGSWKPGGNQREIRRQSAA